MLKQPKVSEPSIGDHKNYRKLPKWHFEGVLNTNFSTKDVQIRYASFAIRGNICELLHK